MGPRFSLTSWQISSSIIHLHSLGSYAWFGLVLGEGRDLFEGCFDVPSFEEYEPLMNLLGRPMHYKQRDVNFLDKLVDTKVWKETGDIELARDAARTALMKNMKSDAILPCLSEVW